MLTCDQASHYFHGREVRLIQLHDYLSVASPESGLFSDWSRNKRYLDLSHKWIPVWQCDFRSKKSRKLMNSIITSDDVSEVLSALNASPENFVHKALKDEQIECIQRIVCHGRDVLAVMPTGLGKSAIYQLTSTVLTCCFVWAVQPTPHQKPPQNSLFFVGLQSGTVPSPSSASEIFTHYELNRRTC